LNLRSIDRVGSPEWLAEVIQYSTLSELRYWGAEALKEESALLKRAAERSPAASTFLSHSSQDTTYLAGVLKILKNHGAEVYIDKKDETLPPYTSRETAIKLRRKIHECRKFILFATRKSKDSKWVPWELGISDGCKKSSDTAIFPGLDAVSDSEWTEREYLGVYDRIVWGDLKGHKERVWMVLNQEKNTATELSEWLSA
jgi:hypothetical protein